MDFVELPPVSLTIDGGHVILTIFVALLATWVAGLMGPDFDTPPQVRLKSERKSIRQLRLPDAAIARVPKAEPGTPSGNRRRSRSWYDTMDHWLRNFRNWEQIPWDDIEFVKEEGTNCRPLLVFVNGRSGGRQGTEVLRQLRHLLHPVQTVDLQHESPQAALEWWSRNGLRYRVLVCGGDGTIGWVLGCLESLKLDYVPPVGILPLGTGNDLARVLGWGGGYTGGGVAPVLLKVRDAHVALLDRWHVACQDAVPSERPSYLPRFSYRKDVVMSNYFGIGIDAAIALDFHQMRESSPHLFVSRLVNKLWYVQVGTKSFFQRATADLASKIVLECGDDGEQLQKVEIPSNLQGIIVMNIGSFGGGSDLWGAADSDDDDDEASSDEEESRHPSNSSTPRARVRPSMSDSKLEVVGVHGSFQLGAAQVGLYSATRLRQASRVRITNSAPMPVQVDGEPWWFSRGGEINLSLKCQTLMLAHHSPGAGVATDVVEWALERQVISMSQRNELMREIATRANYLTRRSSRSANDLTAMRAAASFPVRAIRSE